SGKIQDVIAHPIKPPTMPPRMNKPVLLPPELPPGNPGVGPPRGDGRQSLARGGQFCAWPGSATTAVASTTASNTRISVAVRTQAPRNAATPKMPTAARHDHGGNPPRSDRDPARWQKFVAKQSRSPGAPSNLPFSLRDLCQIGITGSTPDWLP